MPLRRSNFWLVISILFWTITGCLIALVIHAAYKGTPLPDANPETTYNLLALAPALVAIMLAILTQQVVPSLMAGILLGAYMLMPFQPIEQLYPDTPECLVGIRMTVETFILGQLADIDHMKIIVFTLVIGGMVGILSGNGGTASLVRKISGKAGSRNTAQTFAWGAGLCVFFDDYANTMIVGPTMAPLFDKLKISRAKLAYIVDSTSAPVASIALIGTWIGVEIDYINKGLTQLNPATTPDCLTNVTAYGAFLNSIPYRFYPIFALVLVIILALSGRDFGPMLNAERKKLSEATASGTTSDQLSKNVSAAFAWVPILVLVTLTFSIIMITGYTGIPDGQPKTMQTLLENADSYNSILYGALGSSLVAILISRFRYQLREIMDWFVGGMARMFPAIVVLSLAWALSAVMTHLHIGDIASNALREANFSITWLPIAVFIASAIVSFATGTSWGTMGILCPVVVMVSANLLQGVNDASALDLFYASVGSVLAGAIFGDHCSPISDTTVLSAAASGCTLENHVWTQAPYALFAAIIAMLAGNLLCNVLDLSPWIGIAAGMVVMVFVVRVIGKKVTAS